MDAYFSNGRYTGVYPMTLDELIAQSTNPQEFTRLCNAVFADMHPFDYQVIDGTRGDNGNDGYVVSQARMLAIHCPIKPEQRTDAEYLAKIKSDLAKAAKLKADGTYRIERWTFITPRKLADGVISAMRAEAERIGMDASHVEATFLANELNRRAHVLKNFPTLQQLDIQAQLDELKLAVAAKAVQMPAPKPASVLPLVTDGPGEERVRVISAGIPAAEAKVELRVIAFQTRDAYVEINAILTLLRWFEPLDDDRAEYLAFADRGVRLADQLGRPDIGACCHAHKAQVRALAFNLQFIESYFSMRAEQKMGIVVTTTAEKEQQLELLREMDEMWRGEAKAAFDLLKQSSEPFGIGAALEILGTTLGQLAHLHRAIGESAGADRYIGECKELLMAAKDMSRSAGNELGAANAVFNLANQIRFHGKEAEALDLAKSVIPVAAKHGDLVLLQKAQWLEHAIVTGEVPAYEKGERRTWAGQKATTPKQPDK